MAAHNRMLSLLQRGLSRYRGPILYILWIAAFILSWYGFRWYRPEQGHIDHIYRSIMLIPVQFEYVMEGDGSFRPIPAALQVGRFMFAILTLGAAVAAILAVFGRNIRLRRLNNHILILGLGAKGGGLAMEYLSRGSQVAVLEIDPAADGLEVVRELGAVVVTGNAGDEAALDNMRAGHARRIYAMCGDDNVNLEIVHHVNEIYKSGKGKARGAMAVALLRDELFVRAMWAHPVFQESGFGLKVKMFDPNDASARALVMDQGPHIHVPELNRPGAEAPHVVISGFGALGRSLAAQLILQCHYASMQKLRISILGSDSEALERAFMEEYPKAREVCGLAFVKADIPSAGAARAVFPVSGAHILYLCLDNDAAALCYANQLDKALTASGDRMKIVVCVKTSSGLARLLENSERVKVFNITERVCSLEMVDGEVQDIMAKAIMADYYKTTSEKLGSLPKDAEFKGDLAKQIKYDREEKLLVFKGNMSEETRVALLSLSPDSEYQKVIDSLFTRSQISLEDIGWLESKWAGVTLEEKTNNRLPADNLFIKLHAIGVASITEKTVMEVEKALAQGTDGPMETLAAMEHTRWMTEKIMDGWTYGQVRDNPTKRHDGLMPWDSTQLPVDYRERTYAGIKNIPNLMRRWLKARRGKIKEG